MPATSSIAILIVEPSPHMVSPYGHLASGAQITRVTSTTLAKRQLKNASFNLICISASFKPDQIVNLLETVEQRAQAKLTPIVFVVNLSNRLNFIPGVSWAGRIGVIDSYSSRQEVIDTTSRVLQS